MIFSSHEKGSFPIRFFFSKCEQIHKKLRICSYLPKQSLMESFIFGRCVFKELERERKTWAYPLKRFYWIAQKLWFINYTLGFHIFILILLCLKVGKMYFENKIITEVFKKCKQNVRGEACFWLKHTFVADVLRTFFQKFNKSYFLFQVGGCLFFLLGKSFLKFNIGDTNTV